MQSYAFEIKTNEWLYMLQKEDTTFSHIQYTISSISNQQLVFVSSLLTGYFSEETLGFTRMRQRTEQERLTI